MEPVDILIGGFPCQDVSTVGKRVGLAPRAVQR
ncbi:DNA cytosine methyltransferase [Nostocoides vanveenii]